MQFRVVKFPTGAETSIVASIIVPVIWPLAIKFVAVNDVTVGSMEAAPYPLVWPALNMSAYILPAQKKKRGIFVFNKFLGQRNRTRRERSSVLPL